MAKTGLERGSKLREKRGIDYRLPDLAGSFAHDRSAGHPHSPGRVPINQNLRAWYLPLLHTRPDAGLFSACPS